jgi:hypothetical protein
VLYRLNDLFIEATATPDLATAIDDVPHFLHGSMPHRPGDRSSRQCAVREAARIDRGQQSDF